MQVTEVVDPSTAATKSNTETDQINREGENIRPEDSHEQHKDEAWKLHSNFGVYYTVAQLKFTVYIMEKPT